MCPMMASLGIILASGYWLLTAGCCRTDFTASVGCARAISQSKRRSRNSCCAALGDKSMECISGANTFMSAPHRSAPPNEQPKPGSKFWTGTQSAEVLNANGNSWRHSIALPQIRPEPWNQLEAQ
ncbi:uncharacterized protein LOC121467525 [Drosophila elegans]|uniref:uncharacterized protein LOC121467525 n=1 Tax=Drosophila elegans TaxID=30023 RepID=UPI001BC84AC0|nr:uncharacterized protein LOC121467525 [Drosophila elegans]